MLENRQEPTKRIRKKKSRTESKYHMCRGPEANTVEGAAEEAGKGLQATPWSWDLILRR